MNLDADQILRKITVGIIQIKHLKIVKCSDSCSSGYISVRRNL